MSDPTPNPLDASKRLDEIEATGRPVNSADVKSIEGAAGEQPREWAFTIADLAKALDVSRQSIKNWKKAHKDFPQRSILDGRERWNVAEVRDFCRARGLNQRAEPVEDETKALMRERLRIDNDIRRLKRSQISGELLPFQVENAALASGVVHAKNELLRIPQMSIELVGLSAPDIEKKLRGWIVGALKALYTGPTPEQRAEVNRIVAEVERRRAAKKPKETTQDEPMRPEAMVSKQDTSDGSGVPCAAPSVQPG